MLSKIHFKINTPYIAKKDKLFFLQRFVNPHFKLSLGEIVLNDKNKWQQRLPHYIKTGSITLGNLSFGLPKKEAQIKLVEYIQEINAQFDIFVKSNPLILQSIQDKLDQGLLKYEELLKPAKPHVEKTDEIAELSHPLLYNISKDWNVPKHTLAYTAQLEQRTFGINAFDVGLGKAQPLNSLVLTPFGWIEMGKIQEGDEVLAYDGTPVKVLGIFPSGKKDVYQLTFNDGTTVKCCEDHLWFTQTKQELEDSWKHHIKNGVTTLLSGSVKALKDIDINEAHVIPTVCPLDFEEKPYTIHPYFLGRMLTKLHPHLNREDYLHFNYYNDNHEDKVVVNDNAVYFKNKDLKDLFKEYLNNALSVRLALLQGIFDTSYLDKKRKNIIVKVIGKHIAEFIQQIVLSLGGTCHKYYYEDLTGEFEGEDYCHLIIKFPTQFGLIPFINPQKRTIWKGMKVRPLRTIRKIEIVGHEECQCIKIDHPSHLYITDNYVVTHNTSTSLIAIQNLHNKEIKQKTLFVVPPSALSNFKKEAQQVYVNKEDCLFLTNRNKVDEDLLEAQKSCYTKVFMTYDDFYRIKLKEETLSAYLEDFCKHEIVDEESKKFEQFAFKLTKEQGKTKRPIYFEDFGFDSVVIDEIHVYKNSRELFGNINAKYLSTPPASSRGIDAQAKCWYIRKQNKLKDKEDGIIGLTATPLTNSPLEYYALLTLILGDTLNAMMGLNGSQEFMQAICEVETEEDYTVDGEEKMYEVFKGIKNLSILRPILFNIITFLGYDEIQSVVPEKKEILIETEMSSTQKQKLNAYKKAYRVCKTLLYADEAIQQEIFASHEWHEIQPILNRFHETFEITGSAFNFIAKMERLILDDDLDEQGISFYLDLASFDESEMNKLKAIIQGFNQKNYKEKRRPSTHTQQEDIKQLDFETEVLVKAKLDEENQRVFLDTLDYDLQYHFFSMLKAHFNPTFSVSPKLVGCLEAIKKEHLNPRGKTKDKDNLCKQVVFCDHIGLHLKLKVLISERLNLPFSEVEVLTARTNGSTEEVLDIQERFNFGDDLKILIANEKAEVAINLQNGSQAVHHLTFGWTPDSLHQRNGRVVRQFNYTPYVNVYKNLTVNTFDDYKSKLVGNKSSWIAKMLDKDGEDYVPITNLTKKQYEEMLDSLGDLSDLDEQIEKERAKKVLKNIIDKQKHCLSFMISPVIRSLNTNRFSEKEEIKIELEQYHQYLTDFIKLNEKIEKATDEKKEKLIKTKQRFVQEFLEFQSTLESWFVVEANNRQAAKYKEMILRYTDLDFNSPILSFYLDIMIAKTIKIERYHVQMTEKMKNLLAIRVVIFNQLYQQAKKNFIELHHSHPDSLPLSLLDYADKGELFKFKEHFIYPSALLCVKRQLNHYFPIDLKKQLENKEVNVMEQAILEHKVSDFSALPDFEEPDVLFSSAVNAFYLNLIEKRETMLEKDFRIHFVLNFREFLTKVKFNLLKIEDDKQSENLTVLFNVQDDSFNYSSPNRVRMDFLDMIEDYQKTGIFDEFEIYPIYENHFEIFTQLMALFNAYQACYRQGGVSTMRIDELVERIKTEHSQRLTLDKKILSPLNLKFLDTIFVNSEV